MQVLELCWFSTWNIFFDPTWKEILPPNREDIFLVTMLQGELISVFMNSGSSEASFDERGDPEEEPHNIYDI